MDKDFLSLLRKRAIAARKSAWKDQPHNVVRSIDMIIALIDDVGLPYLKSRPSRAADVCPHCGQPFAVKTAVCMLYGGGHAPLLP